MSSTCTTRRNDSVFRNVEWSATSDVAGPILRRAALGAVLADNRIQIEFDPERGEYVLGIRG